jgi:hypothetical protein
MFRIFSILHFIKLKCSHINISYNFGLTGIHMACFMQLIWTISCFKMLQNSGPASSTGFVDTVAQN